MVIPLFDNDPLEKSRRAYVNWALIAACIAVFLLQQARVRQFDAIIIRNFALFPVALTGEADTGAVFPTSFSGC